MHVKTVDYRSPVAAQDFTTSLRETGFAVLDHHPLSYELLSGVADEWARFFATDEKFQFLFTPENQVGYFPFKSENAKGFSHKDLKEFFHYYPKKNPLPASLQRFTPKMYEQLETLAGELLGWIQETTPDEIRAQFSIPLPEMIRNSEETVFRALHYPPLTGEEDGALRAAAHEDINLITLLPAATAPGLQVRDVQGRWIDVVCDPGMIVINAGDMLRMASGGFYPSTTHQVINPTGSDAQKSRYSFPLFLHPRGDVVLSPTHTAREYLHERLRELGLM